MTPDQFTDEFEQALASQDWAQVAPLVHDDACVQFSEATYRGKAAVRKAFENTFAHIQNEHYAMTDLHWVAVTESMATCIFNFHWRGWIDGQPSNGSGRGTSVLKREGTRWQLLVEHLGPEPR